MNVMSWADQHLERYGEFEALICGDERWTSTQLHDQSLRLASALIRLGLGPGDRVLLWLPNSAPLVVAFTAAIRAGGAAIILSDATPAGEVRRIAEHAGARLLITEEAMRPAVADLEGVRVLCTGGEAPDALPALIRDAAPLLEPVARQPDDVAQIVYTSGTSGQPKGVVWTHATIESRYRAFEDKRPSSRPARRSLCALPLAAAFGAQYLYLRTLQKMTLVLLDRFDPEGVQDTIARHQIEAAMMVPAMCEALLAHPRAEPAKLSSLVSLLVGGSAVSSSLVTRFWRKFRVRLTTVYGLTELGPVATARAGDASGAVGSVREGIEVRIVDASGAPLPAGEIGEVELAAGRMRADYFGAEAGDSLDTWFKTGDLGRLDEGGELHIVGRSKDVIIQGGINVYPREIVDAVVELEAVADCAAVGVADPFLGEAVAVCIRVQDGAALSAEEVYAHCRARLDARRLPAHVIFVGEVPRNQLGKVRADELRATAAQRLETRPETELRARLAAATAAARPAILMEDLQNKLRAILGTDDLDPSETFGRLGLESMGAVQFANLLAGSLGHPVSPTLSFNHPSLEAVCRHLLGELFPEPSPTPAAETRAAPSPVPGPSSPIAILGAACRLPGDQGDIETPAALWEALLRGFDASGEITRWDLDASYAAERGVPGKTYVRRASLLRSFDRFDAGFFGLSAREATALDPQHRLVLETAWHALEDADIDPHALAHRQVGVFLGISGNGYRSRDPIGASPAMAPGRLAHLLDLRGPVVAVDTTCSSSLVAIHSALHSLRDGECELALAGGVNVIPAASSFVGLSQVQALASDGRSKAFSTAADGFGRGEGCVLFVLSRDADPGARVRGLIRGAVIGHDGRSSSLTAPNGEAQEELIRASLARVRLSGPDIDYVEAHGTGTRLGDPIEIEAARAAYGPRTRPAHIGSVKSNIGHLEAAAGAAGVLKAVLVLEHGVVPPHPFATSMAPSLVRARDVVVPAAHAEPLTASVGPHRATVMAMGMSGTNAHVILEEAPRPPASGDTDDREQLLCISARSRDAAFALAQRYDTLLSTEGPALADVAHSAGVGRAHMEWRLAAVASSREAMRSSLASAAPRRTARPPTIAFLCSAQGSQVAGMGRELADTEPVFAETLRRCSEIASPLLGRDLLGILHGDDAELLARTDITQPAVFSISVALAALWRSWGVEADIVLGHSLGEYTAACLAGALSLEQALPLVVRRGQLMAGVPGNSAMAAVAAPLGQVEASLGPELEIASINGPESVTISGSIRDIEAAIEHFKANGVKSTRLAVSAGFHSRFMDPIATELEAAVSGLAFSNPTITMVSTVTGEAVDAAELSRPDYWRRGLRQRVEFMAAVRHAVARGATAFIEIGPRPVLLGMARACIEADDVDWLPSMSRDRGERSQMLQSLGQLYTAGVLPRWSALHREGRRRVAIPLYPFQREAYWDPDNPRREPVLRRIRAASAATQPSESLAAMSPEDRLQAVRRTVGELVERSSGRAAEAHHNLVDHGLDSLRVMQLLGDVRRHLGVPLRPADFNAHPTTAALSTLIAERLAGTPSSGAEDGQPHLVTIREGGREPVLVCMHPAGGQVTAYLPLRRLCPETQPIRAIQSRAVTAPQLGELPSLATMTSAYADLTALAAGSGPVRLLGWSMGGVLAHRVAAALEERSIEVEWVAAIDPPSGRGLATDALELGLAGIVYDLNPAPPADVFSKLRARPAADPALLVAFCERQGLLPAGAIRPDELAAAFELYRQHSALLRAREVPVIRAPLHVWWAGREQPEWLDRSSTEVRSRIVRETHYSIVRPPSLDAIVAELWSSPAAG